MRGSTALLLRLQKGFLAQVELINWDIENLRFRIQNKDSVEPQIFIADVCGGTLGTILLAKIVCLA
jgi:hypothetical protein